MNANDTQIPFPIWTIAKVFGRIMITKRKTKSNCNFCCDSQIQDNTENIKNNIFNICFSLSFTWKTIITKTIENICVLNYIVADSNDKSNINDSNNIDINSDSNIDAYKDKSEDNYNSGDDDNYIENKNNKDNSSIKNNYNYLRTDSKNDSSNSIQNTSTQTNSISISNGAVFVKNITENIQSETETLDTTINNFEPQATDQIATPPLSKGEDHTLLPISHFKSYVPNINTQEDIDDGLCHPFSYQYMFDKRTSPWEMKDWDHDELNTFVIEPEKIDRLYHMVADDEDQNFRSWEICCRMDYKGEKYFVEMYANCDYTGFDCQGGGRVSITKLPDFFLENMVTMDQNPDRIYKSLREDGYNVQEPDLLHKVHPKFWNNAPMLKYLCHNAIYKHRDILPHFNDQLPKILVNSVDEFIKVKDWDNE